jgi:hypothetical protein
MNSKFGLALLCFLLGAGIGVGIGSYTAGHDTGAEPDAEPFRMVNPLAEAQVGEWALYRLLDGKTMRMEIVDVHPQTRVVTVEEEQRDPRTNARVSLDANKKFRPNHFLWGFDGVGAIVHRIYPDRITVAGRTFDCFCVETSARSMGPVKTWYSPDIPALGMVRQERPNQVTAELLDWSGREP